MNEILSLAMNFVLHKLESSAQPLSFASINHKSRNQTLAHGGGRGSDSETISAGSETSVLNNKLY